MRHRTTKAARIKNSVLDSSFTIEMALICVGFEDHEVNSDVINQVTNELMNYDQLGTLTKDSILERSVEVYENAIRWPNIAKDGHLHDLIHILPSSKAMTSKNKSAILRLCGGSGKNADGGGNLYKALTRKIEKRKKDADESRRRVGATTSVLEPLPFHIGVAEYEIELDEERVLHRTSDISDLTSTPGRGISSLAASQSSPALEGSVAHSSSSRQNNSRARNNTSQSKVRSSKFVGFDNAARRDLGLDEVRLTSIQRHELNRQKQMEEELRDLSHIVGTIMLDRSQKMTARPPGLRSSDQVADKVNSMFNLDVGKSINGSALLRAVRKGEIGIPPPKRGHSSVLPVEDVNLFASALFTFRSIEQANCDSDALKRNQIISMLDTVLNEESLLKKRDGLEINASVFFTKLKSINSAHTDLDVRNTREAIRSIWLTFNNLNDHYKSWEDFVVRLGMARPSTTEEFERTGEYVIFNSGQVERILNADEMGMGLDGAANNVGGRPEKEQTHPDLPKPGRSEYKSSLKGTYHLGTNFNDEPLPYLLVAMSSAKNPSVSGELVSRLHQIEGKFGHTVRKWFDPLIAYSEKGGVTTDIFLKWVEDTVLKLYPNVEDKPGKRVVMKFDCGPGRYNEKFLLLARALGIYFFPGLPNGTEITQEMDALYHLVKSIGERNRQKIYDARFKVMGESAKVHLNDLPVMLHGGTFEVTAGNFIELENAIAIGLSPDKIKGAREKCGYVPATRAALKSPKLRHEYGTSAEQTSDSSADQSLDQRRDDLLSSLEMQNQKDVEELVARGYTQATLLKRKVKRLTTAQTEARASVKTRPLSDERITNLMQWKTAGVFNRMTNGGDAMNGTDALIARALNRNNAEIITLKAKEVKWGVTKKKWDIWKSVDNRLKASPLLLDRRDPKNYSGDELKAIIILKHPDCKGLSKMNKTALGNEWNRKYYDMPFPDWTEVRYTKGDQRRLLKLEERKIPDLEETSVYRDMMELRSDLFATQLKQLPEDYLSHVIAKVLNEKDNRETILGNVNGRIARKDMSIPCPGECEGSESCEESVGSENSVDNRDPRNTGIDFIRKRQSILSGVYGSDSEDELENEAGEEDNAVFESDNLSHDGKESIHDEDVSSGFNCCNTNCEGDAEIDRGDKETIHSEDISSGVNCSNTSSDVDTEIGRDDNSDKSMYDEDIPSDSIGGIGFEVGASPDWNSMNRKQLVAECKKRGIKADGRNTIATLMSKLNNH